MCVATAAPHTPKIASTKAAELNQLTSAPITTQSKPYTSLHRWALPAPPRSTAERSEIWICTRKVRITTIDDTTMKSMKFWQSKVARQQCFSATHCIKSYVNLNALSRCTKLHRECKEQTDTSNNSSIGSVAAYKYYAICYNLLLRCSRLICRDLKT